MQMNERSTQTKCTKATIPLLLLAGCLGAPDAADLLDDEGPTNEALLAFTIGNTHISASESPSWPKTVTWCVNGGHETHKNFSWKASWQSTNIPTNTHCVSYQSSIEKCDLSAMVDRDYVGTGTPYHTGDIANPKRYSLFDHRPSFTLSVSPTLPVQVNQSVSLTAPFPHCQRHCDGTGTLRWWQKNANGTSWTELTAANDKCTLTVPGSSSPGTETFKLVSTHQGQPSVSNEVTVTWAACPSGQTMCSGTCVNLIDDPCYCGSCEHSCGNGYCDQGACKSCFAAGTSITMADGSEKPIESITVGDWVLGYDTNGKTTLPARVSHTFVHSDTAQSLLLNGNVRVTPEHPFYMNGAWIEAGNLQPGDQLHRLVTSESTPQPVIMTVEQIENIPGALTTYNIEVENVHNYFAGGYLVHNKPVGCFFQDIGPERPTD